MLNIALTFIKLEINFILTQGLLSMIRNNGLELENLSLPPRVPHASVLCSKIAKVI